MRLYLLLICFLLALLWCEASKPKRGILVLTVTSAELAASGLIHVSGVVRTMESEAAFPKFPGFSACERGITNSGAIRIRSAAIKGLSPDRTCVLPIILHFESAKGVSSYRIEVQELSGNTVYELQSSASEAAVPPGVLKPESRYFWRVR